MNRYQLTETARNDLIEILDYVESQSGAARAEHLQAEFTRVLGLVCSTPNMGVRKPHLTGESTRWWFMHSYSILYIKSEQTVIILRIIHGARDLFRLLDDEA